VVNNSHELKIESKKELEKDPDCGSFIILLAFWGEEVENSQPIIISGDDSTNNNEQL
jgi:hypothetical protein